MEENRVRLACVGAPKKNKIGLRHLLIRTGGAARPEDRRQTGDARGMSSSIATVNVVAADHRANEFLRDIVQLVGRFRTAEHAEAAWPVRFDLAAQLAGDEIERFLPACPSMTVGFANQWGREPARSDHRHLKLPPECAAESVGQGNGTKGIAMRRLVVQAPPAAQ